MNENLSVGSGEDEALVRVVYNATTEHPELFGIRDTSEARSIDDRCHDIARAVLTSDWLAGFKAAAEKRGAEAVVAAVEAAFPSGSYYDWMREKAVTAARAASAAVGGDQ